MTTDFVGRTLKIKSIKNMQRTKKELWALSVGYGCFSGLALYALLLNI